MAINGCAECLKKQREIDRLTEEIHGLRQKLRYQERRAIEGFFGTATPSAKRPVTANTPPAKEPKRKGARPGHLGVGRQAFDASQAERVVEVAAEVGERCPDCDAPLEEKGTDSRLVVDSHPVKAERVLYRLPKHYCPRCRRTFQPRAPAVLPKSLYGNQMGTNSSPRRLRCTISTASPWDASASRRDWARGVWSRSAIGWRGCVLAFLTTS